MARLFEPVSVMALIESERTETIRQPASNTELSIRDGAQLRAADLVQYVRRELAAPKTPAHWILLDAFPLTGSGKLQKFVLRDRYLAGEFSGQLLR